MLDETMSLVAAANRPSPLGSAATAKTLATRFVDLANAFPPGCPVLYSDSSSLVTVIGTVESFRNGVYRMKATKGMIIVTAESLQFAPSCPVWVLPWKKSNKWKQARVLGSFKKDGAIFYTACETATDKKLVHYSIPVERIRFCRKVTDDPTCCSRDVQVTADVPAIDAVVEKTLVKVDPPKNAPTSIGMDSNASTGEVPVMKLLEIRENDPAHDEDSFKENAPVLSAHAPNALSKKIPKKHHRINSNTGSVMGSLQHGHNTSKTLYLPKEITTKRTGMPLPRKRENASSDKAVIEEETQEKRQKLAPVSNPSTFSKSIVQTIILPSWMDLKLLQEKLIGEAGRNLKELELKLRCRVRIKRGQLPWRIEFKSNFYQEAKQAIVVLEDLLITVVSPRERGLLLHDLAQINGYGERFCFLVRQRDPSSLNTHMWMHKILFPGDFRTYSGIFVGPEGSGILPILKETNCVVDLPRKGGGHYSLISGAEIQDVQRCIEMVKERIRFSMSELHRCGRNCF